MHRVNFLHWNDCFFENVTLCDLGQEVNLGHAGLPCPQPMAEVKSFTVVHLTGVHSIHLCYCSCRGAPEQCIQLLRLGWFPASLKSPETAFTFDLLNTFHILNLQSKIVLFDFWNAIRHKTDNVGTKDIKVILLLHV